MSGYEHNGMCCQSCYRWHCSCSQEYTSRNRRSPLFGHEPQCYNYDNYCHCASSEPYQLPPEGSGTAHSPPEPPLSQKMSVEKVRASYSSFSPYHTHLLSTQPYQLPREGFCTAQSLPETALPTNLSIEEVIAHSSSVGEHHLPDHTPSRSTNNHHRPYYSSDHHWPNAMSGHGVPVPSAPCVSVPPHTSPPPYSCAGDSPPSYEEAVLGPQFPNPRDKFME